MLQSSPAWQNNAAAVASEQCLGLPAGITAVAAGDVAGTVEVSCTGVYDSLAELTITATLTATTPASPPGSATSSSTVRFVCCSAATTSAHVVSSAGSSCSTCGLGTAVEGVWHLGALPASGIMRAGALRPADCSSSGAGVGSVMAVCETAQHLRVTITNPAVGGSSAAPAIKALTRCSTRNAAPGQGTACTAGGFRWSTVTAAKNGLTVTSDGSSTTSSFGVQLAGGCSCDDLLWAVKQTGVFVTGAVGSSGGACPAENAAARARIRG